MTLIHNQQQRLINFQDGRRLPNDDLRAIQRQLDNLTMLFAGWGAFVLTGCEVSVNSNNNSLRDVAEGLVYINDNLIYFPGVTGLDLSSSQYMVEISSLQLAPRGYVLSGTTEEGLMEYRVDMLSSKPGSGEYIEFQESGAQRTKASDLDLPQAVIDIANLQSNKADKGPQTSFQLAGTHFSYSSGFSNAVPAVKIFYDNLGYLHLRGRFQGSNNNGEVFVLPNNLNGVDYTPASPSRHFVAVNPGQNNCFFEINTTGECFIRIDGAYEEENTVFDLGEIIINPAI